MFPLNPIDSLNYCVDNSSKPIVKMFQGMTFNKSKTFLKCVAKGIVPGYEMAKSDKQIAWNLINEGNKIFNCN